MVPCSAATAAAVRGASASAPLSAAAKLPASTAEGLLYKWSRQPGRIRIVFDKIQKAQEFARLDKRDRITLDDLAEADTYTPPAVGSDSEGGES